MEKAVFGNGCFWCTEAVFMQLEGVESVNPGYTGGHIKNPCYKEVCNGTTGHAEAVEIIFDPAKIGYDKLLEVFFSTHDPTTLNRQGNDVGTQYRSVIFYHSEKQKKIAIDSIVKADKSGYWPNKIVTELTEIFNYLDAEDYHNNYYDNNPNQPYCLFVIKPKLDRLIDKGIIK